MSDDEGFAFDPFEDLDDDEEPTIHVVVHVAEGSVPALTMSTVEIVRAALLDLQHDLENPEQCKDEGMLGAVAKITEQYGSGEPITVSLTICPPGCNLEDYMEPKEERLWN